MSRVLYSSIYMWSMRVLTQKRRKAKKGSHGRVWSSLIGWLPGKGPSKSEERVRSELPLVEGNMRTKAFP